MTLITWISWPLIKSLWAAWGIQFLVTVGLACEILLATLGSRRKYMTWNLSRFIIWATYLLLSNVATIALGKLTLVRIHNPENPGNDAVLEGLLAPLLLMQLGYPDSITAYAAEDNLQGLKQTGNIVAKVGLAVWVLIRCFDSSSSVSSLYFPLIVVGIMKSVGWVWALQSVYDENLGMTSEYINEYDSDQRFFKEFPQDEKFKSAKDILQAYFRFRGLKPHLMNWRYNPLFLPHDWTSIDSYTANHTFSITEIELNFMYDTLYTKVPVLYTNFGLIGRFFGFFCLVSALCAFATIFKNAFLIDMYITYTYVLLMAVTSLELYQIFILLFSDWAVVKMSVNLKVPLIRRLLPFLAKQCMKQRRWSRSVGRLNLLDPHLLFKEFPKPIATVLDWYGKREIVWRYWLHSRQAIPSSLKVLVVQNMAKLEKKIHLLPFTKRGKWMLKTHGIQEKQVLSSSMETTFDRSIIIWHIATEILHRLESEYSNACTGSKLLSDYMMYLLALRPHILSLTTADILLEYACCTLRPFLRNRDYNEAISTLSSPDGEVPPPVKPSKETRITRDWDVLSEVQKLVVDLRTLDNKWELISSVWVEMLCFAAYNCQVYHHAKSLRKGGELITHVWLLLAHKTNIPKLPKDLATTSESPPSDSQEERS
ncbi:uncharacterized protein LOC120294406 [Eucalyptus grandis]|uniref:uncharacterized protein LOC120294406 n=1 Tax=Eucalyptus grandis TaxID=71139 RepID=UPI00192EC8C9|nr:uncharacterized protein LOC120294406 [Eucalyptus grandis]